MRARTSPRTGPGTRPRTSPVPSTQPECSRRPLLVNLTLWVAGLRRVGRDIPLVQEPVAQHESMASLHRPLAGLAFRFTSPLALHEPDRAPGIFLGGRRLRHRCAAAGGENATRQHKDLAHGPQHGARQPSLTAAGDSFGGGQRSGGLPWPSGRLPFHRLGPTGRVPQVDIRAPRPGRPTCR